MKLPDRIRLKKTLIYLAVYAVLLAVAGHQLIQSYRPIEDPKLKQQAIQYKDAISSDPNNSDCHAKLAWTYQQIGVNQHNSLFFKKAVKEYRKSLDLAPHNIDVRYNLAILYEKMGQKSNSKSEYETILSIDPRHVAALVQLGELAAKTGDLDKATELLKKATELESTAGDTYYELGKVYEQKQDDEQAVLMYKKAIQYIPNLTDALERIHSLSGK